MRTEITIHAINVIKTSESRIFELFNIPKPITQPCPWTRSEVKDVRRNKLYGGHCLIHRI